MIKRVRVYFTVLLYILTIGYSFQLQVSQCSMGNFTMWVIALLIVGVVAIEGLPVSRGSSLSTHTIILTYNET